MKRTNLFVVCGYSGQAPAGTSTDTNIVNAFFSYTNAGDGVVYAWKKGNNYVGTYPWGALSYGTTNANMNFKMPGWGSNTGIDRSQSIWYVNQSSATVITPLVTNASHANPEDLPTTVSIHGTQRHERDVWENRRQMRFSDIRKRIPAGYSCLLLFELSLTPPFSVAKSTTAL